MRGKEAKGLAFSNLEQVRATFDGVLKLIKEYPKPDDFLVRALRHLFEEDSTSGVYSDEPTYSMSNASWWFETYHQAWDAAAEEQYETAEAERNATAEQAANTEARKKLAAERKKQNETEGFDARRSRRG